MVFSAAKTGIARKAKVAASALATIGPVDVCTRLPPGPQSDER